MISTARKNLTCWALVSRGLLLLLTKVHLGNCQIISSSDLNCNFNTNCQWRNATNGEQDDGDFWLTSNLFMDTQHISPKGNDIGDKFAYTHSALDGFKNAMLISDVVSCQLGGAILKLWYYRTDVRTTLEACMRQPPGNLLPAGLTCFPMLAGNHIRQWLYAATEFPPMSQPFELIIKATFVQPHDLVAIDDIAYDAILCENSYVAQSTAPDSTRKPPSIITADNIVIAPEETSIKSPPKLIVAHSLPDVLPNVKKTATANETQSFLDITQKIVPLLIPALFEMFQPMGAEKRQADDLVPRISQAERKPIVPVNSFPLNAASPVIQSSLDPPLPMVRSFGVKQKESTQGLLDSSLLPSSAATSVAPEVDRSSTVAKYPNPRRTLKVYKIQMNDKPEIWWKARTFDPMELMIRTTVPPRLMSYSYPATTTRVTTTHEATFENKSYTLGPTQNTSETEATESVKRNPFEDLKRFRKMREKSQSIGSLGSFEDLRTTTEGVRAVSEVSQKIPEPTKEFWTRKPVINVKKDLPQFISPENPQKAELEKMTKKVPTDVIQNLPLLKSVPNLDELLEGLDLTLLKTPHGFAQLRQQFLQRLINRKISSSTFAHGHDLSNQFIARS